VPSQAAAPVWPATFRPQPACFASPACRETRLLSWPKAVTRQQKQPEALEKRYCEIRSSTGFQRGAEQAFSVLEGWIFEVAREFGSLSSKAGSKHESSMGPGVEVGGAGVLTVPCRSRVACWGCAATEPVELLAANGDSISRHDGAVGNQTLATGHMRPFAWTGAARPPAACERLRSLNTATKLCFIRSESRVARKPGGC
jgi:hypothetical protein